MPGFWFSNRKGLMSRFPACFTSDQVNTWRSFFPRATLCYPECGIRNSAESEFATTRCMPMSGGLDRSNPDREEVLDYAPVKEPGRLASLLRSSDHPNF